jgi:hypothetical protein
MARLVRRRDAGAEFDQEFWQQVGHEGRFAAMWQMVKEVQAMRGGNGRQPRLQRSVQSIERLSRKVRETMTNNQCRKKPK